MKKHLLVSVLALAVVASTANISMAASNSAKSFFKGIGNQISSDAKSVAKDVKESAKQDVQNQVKANKKAQLSKVKEQKNATLKPLNDKIAAKKKEITAVKKANITETERTLKLAKLNRELKYLQTRKDNIEKTYNNRIDALK